MAFQAYSMELFPNVNFEPLCLVSTDLAMSACENLRISDGSQLLAVAPRRIDVLLFYCRIQQCVGQVTRRSLPLSFCGLSSFFP
jgi:hypothetical protein